MNTNRHFTAFLNYFTLAILALTLITYSCDTNDECEGTSTCINGFFQSTAGCDCFCFNSWEGTECNICLLQDEDCLNGTADTIDCKCNCDPAWCGPECDIPVLTCENAGSWDEFTCSCDCPEGWGGAVCDSML